MSSGLIYYDDRESVINDNFKLIRLLDGSHEELYNLIQDPGEQTSIVTTSPDEAEEARILLGEHKKTASELREQYDLKESERATLHQGTIRVLKSLGYVQ